MNTISRPARFACLLFGFSVVLSASAVDIANPGFEEGWEGWTDGDPSGSGTAISKKANNGEKSVKLTEKSTYAAQVVAVQPNTNYRLSAFVLGIGNLGAKVGTEIFFEQSPKKSKKEGKAWTPMPHKEKLGHPCLTRDGCPDFSDFYTDFYSLTFTDFYIVATSDKE